ncbi:hypothetical protein SAMN05444365_105406 [Micromonospora pattaloongensis]|uniref:Uncharacterized protein n=1 Tax=Micromonospora pattaloongensis TaxID=405436 RepID=A0A1H3QFW8_9ACTN|nr:hypothetical protein [Micromonospora pattaloongensis]SDZ11915.1 hypothetical protein SAMN05444365_105406 [Micromonospora pattaloongensis]
MALPRKGSRPITVDGVDYRWMVRRRASAGPAPLSFVVEHADDPGALLVVSLPWAHPRPGQGRPGEVVRPGIVASAITTARDRGWHPDQPGPPFPLSGDDLSPLS